MGLLGAVLGGIGAALGGVCGAIGGALGAICTGIAGVLSALPLGLIVGTINLVCGIAKLLGIQKEKEKPEELGMKAEKSGKHLEDFPSYEEYKKHLDSIELTPEEKSRLENDENLKIKYGAIGSAILYEGIKNHYGMELPYENFVTMARMKLSPEEAKATLDKCKENGVKPDIKGAIEGTLPLSESDKVMDALESTINSSENKTKIQAELDEMLKNI